MLNYCLKRAVIHEALKRRDQLPSAPRKRGQEDKAVGPEFGV